MKLFFACLSISLTVVAQDTTSSYSGFFIPANYTYVPSRNDVQKCLICDGENLDSYFMSKYSCTVHKKCYNPVFEIEQIYALSLFNCMKKKYPSIEPHSNNYIRKRKELIQQVVQLAKEQNIYPFDDKSDTKSRLELKKIFTKTYFSMTGEEPFSEYTK